MKRRSLSFFLAILMVFGSVLPVFATEVQNEPIVEDEQQTPTITYEDLYVEDAVFAWDAFGKTTEDVLDFGEGDTLVLGTYGDKELVLTKPSDKGSAAYGNGYLEITDYNANAKLSIANAYDNVPGKNDVTKAAYTTQMTIALLKNESTLTKTVSAVGRQYAVPFTSFNTHPHVQTFGMSEAFNLVNDDNMAVVNAWSRAYLAAKNDASLQASFRTPISKAHYDLLAADATYKDHVFTVEVGGEGVAAYSQTGYEADYTAFAYMLKTYPYNDGYYDAINYNPDTNAKIYASGVAKVTINTAAWMTDRDWKSSIGTLWTRKGLEEVATQTRINAVTYTSGAEKPYTSKSSVYVDDYQAVAPTTKTGATAPTAAFTLADGFDARYYSIRIYEGELSALQMAQNHFADLCGYYAIDLAPLATVLAENEDLRDDILMGIYNASTTLTIGKTDADAVNAVITDVAHSLAATKNRAAYDAMYVTKDLMYRWDAYNIRSVSGTTLLMPDENGGDTVLSLNNVSYNATYKVPETTNPYDFSKLITRTNGVYDEENLEFELIMTQTYADETLNKDSRPHVALGPIAGNGSSGVRTEYDKDTNAKGWTVSTYGGYATIYYGLRAVPANGTTSIEKVTYYFDADGNRVNAAVDGGNQVTISYHSGTQAAQIADQTWASLKRWHGNPLGESYSLGGTINFDLAKGAKAGYVKFQMYRDGKVVPGGNYDNISYVPGYNAATVGTKIVPETYKQALEMASGHISANNTGYDADKGVFQIAGSKSTSLKLGYYAFRLYSRHLTDAERMQNHFADLCNYHCIDNILAYDALSDAHKAAIYTDPKFHNAKIDSRTEVSNTSFEDVTKEELEAAIDVYVKIEEAEKAAAERLAKYEKLAEMYVDDASFIWTAYGAEKGSPVGTVTDSKGAILTVSGGTSAYSNGYLRAAGSTLTVAGVYDTTKPTGDQKVNYTTEMVYATYDDGAALPQYSGEAKFETNYGVIFAQNVSNVFTTFASTENIHFTDTVGRKLQEDWASAYVAAEKDDALKATFWTPISETDYKTITTKDEHAAQVNNVRKVGGDSGNTAVGAYSKTGYEANWEGFQYVLNKLGRKNYYHGYNYSVATKPGIGNSNVMKTDISISGDWTANLDFDNWGEAGIWSRHDFGEIVNHTWTETLFFDESYKIDYAKYDGVDSVYSSKKYAFRSGAPITNPKLSANFEIKGFDADYYAIRIYPFTLSEAERAQNHFADLCGKYGIDNVDTFFALTDNSKAALYTAFASTLMAETNKDALEGAINAAAAKEDAFAALGVTAEKYVEFLGYQVRMYDYAGLRSVYEVKNGAVDGLTLKEAGAIMAIAGERTVADLTVEKISDGYAVSGEQMASAVVYNGTAWGDLYETADGKQTFAYTCTFDTVAGTVASELTVAEKLTTDLIFRGYVVVEYEGVDFILYTDMDSQTFGETISMYEASKYEAFASFATSREVIAIVDGIAE